METAENGTIADHCRNGQEKFFWLYVRNGINYDIFREGSIVSSIYFMPSVSRFVGPEDCSSQSSGKYDIDVLIVR